MSAESTWTPDCLDRLLACVNGSPKTRALSGYLLMRVLFAIITAHSAVIFASIITAVALQVTDCRDSNSGVNSCTVADDDTVTSGKCHKLWGLIKADSLLTVIGTVAAIFLAFSATLSGTYMDVTSHRRKMGLIGNLFSVLGMFMCCAIVVPTENTLIVCSVGLILVVTFKDWISMQIDSYGPELSKDPAEVATAVSAGFGLALVAEVFGIIVWVIVGLGGMSTSLYGFVVSIVSGVFLFGFTILTYTRLPDVPAAHVIPPGKTILTLTTDRLSKLARQTYHEYPDLGLVLVSGMLYDPALTAIFAAAVLIMIGKYHFSAEQTTYFLGLGILFAIPAVPFSRWLCSTPLLNCVFGDDAVIIPSFPGAPSAGINKPTIRVMESNSGTSICETVNNSTKNSQKNEEENQGSELESGVELVSGRVSDYRLVQTAALQSELILSMEEDVNVNIRDGEMGESIQSVDCGDAVLMPASPLAVEKEGNVVFHLNRVRVFIILGLVAVIINSILVLWVLKPCNVGLGAFFSILWGFLLSFCWNNFNMLRIGLVPGGQEAEFAGLYLAMFSGMIWLPLFLFSVANEVWNVDGAMYILCAFFASGAAVLGKVNIQRGIRTRRKSLKNRRWSEAATDESDVEIGEQHTVGSSNVETVQQA